MIALLPFQGFIRGMSGQVPARLAASQPIRNLGRSLPGGWCAWTTGWRNWPSIGLGGPPSAACLSTPTRWRIAEARFSNATMIARRPPWPWAIDAGLHRPPPAGADPDAVLRQRHRVRHGAADPRRRHRPDAVARTTSPPPRWAASSSRRRSASITPMWLQYGRWVGGILFHGDFGKSLWQNTPVSEYLLARLPITFELGRHGAGRRPAGRHPDRRLFGDAPGHAPATTSRAPSRS